MNQLTSPFSAEQRLLLAAARATHTPASREQLAALLPAITHWQALLAMGASHGVAPLLFQSISPVGQQVPTSAYAALQVQARQVAQSNLRLTGELMRILAIFAAAGIPAIPYKGPALAMQVYANLGLRPFGDLDVFIPRADLVRARAVLMQAGYQPLPEPPGYHFGPGHTRHYHEYSLMSADGLVRFELQWSVIQQPFAFPMRIERWWDVATPTRLGSTTMLQLPPEHTLLILCVHGAKHIWERLMWVCDIAELLHTTPDLDWQAVQALAQHERVARMVLLGAYLAHALLDAPLPAAVLRQATTDSEIAYLANVAVAFMFRQAASQDDLLERRNRFLFQVSDGIASKLQIGLKYAGQLVNPLAFYRRHGRLLLRHLLDH